MRRWIIVLVVLLILGGGIWAFINSRRGAPTGPTRLEVPVSRGSLRATVSASGNLAMPRQGKLTFGVSGVLSEVLVQRGDVVTAGQVLARLDDEPLKLAAAQARASLRTAELNLYKLQHQYSAVDIAEAEVAVRSAEVALENAKRSLEMARSSDRLDKVRQLHYEANWYETDYGEAKRLYEGGQIDKDEHERRLLGMLKAKDKYQVAQQELANAIASAENAVAQAENKLLKEQDNLAKKRRGAEPEDIELKTVAVMSAQANYDNALKNLENATLKAPYAGVIADTTTKIGERIADTAVVAHLVDPSQVRIDALVDEVDVPKVAAGQPVAVTFDAIPNLQLQAHVAAVSPVGTKQAGVVNYAVTINTDSTPPNAPLREGMTALATITVAERNDVLLVPNRALRTVAGRTQVQVMVDGAPQQRPVRIGLSSEQFTEVLDGVKEGDIVAIDVAGTTTRTGQASMPMPIR